MRATRLKAETSPTGKSSKQIFAENEKAEIEKIFHERGLPGWLGWGTYGAESSYGKVGLGRTGGFGFGLIEPSYEGKAPKAGDVYYNAEIAADLYKHLLAEGLDLPQAISKYSGGSYGEQHVFQLGGEKASSFRAEHEGKDTEGTLGEPGLPEPSIGNPLDTIGSLISLLTSGETWLRLGEIVAGGILLLLGLKSLTGAEFPTAVPVPV